MTEIRAQPFDRSVVIDIYLDGLCTGAATAAMLLGFAEADADRIADDVATKVRDDPAAMEQVRKEVLERIKGIDSGPYTFTVHTAERPGREYRP